MTDSEGDLSFDPKSWGRKRGESEPAAESAPQASPQAPAQPQSPAETLPPLFAASRPRRAAPAAPPARRKPPIAALVGGGVVVVAAIAGAAIFLKPSPKPAEQARAPVARQAFKRGMALADLSGLADSLKAEGVSVPLAGRIASAAQGALGGAGADLRMVLSLSPGSPPTFQAVELRRADGSGARVKLASDGSLSSEALASDLQTRVKVVRGEMDANSFYTSAVAAGIVDQVVPSFAAAFAFDFDFQREIRPGDIFEAVFEHQVDQNGGTVGPERLVYASLQTQSKSRALYLYRAPGGAEAWYDGNGVSIVRGLMRTPVEGARITSNFGPRVHPVLGYTRQHKGTDFAVAIGTPVYASGDGAVDFVGPHGEHGNYVRVRHSPTLETAYAHLSGYGTGIVVGAMVHQGQAIALSGNTGLSTGPHLHYEVIVNGEQVDSMTFETTSGHSLQGEELVAFRKERDRIDALRAAQNG